MCRVSSAVSSPFLDPNFDLTDPDTFKAIFQFSSEKTNFSKQVRLKRLTKEDN